MVNRYLTKLSETLQQIPLGVMLGKSLADTPYNEVPVKVTNRTPFNKDDREQQYGQQIP